MKKSLLILSFAITLAALPATSGGVSEFVSSSPSGGEAQELTVKIVHDQDARVNEGESLTLPCEVSGGAEPFSYSWRNAADEVLSQDASLTIAPQHSDTYFLTVTDAHGNSASARSVVLVSGKQYVATFDDLYLAPESYWRGYVDDPDYASGNFYSGSFGFNNNYISEWNSWNGFAYSDMTSTSFSSYFTDQYNCAVGHGAADSANFGVVFVSNWQGATEMTLSNTTIGESVEGMWVTNSAWVVDAILNGDGMEGKFGKGDWLKLKLTGVKADGSETETLESYLADYQSADEAERWYLDTWQWIDLKPLGDVVKIRYDIDSTKKNKNGITTPTYVCIDNVGTGPDVVEVDTQMLAVNDEEPSATLDIAPFFTFDDAVATVNYSLVEQSDYAVLSGSTLTVTASADSEFTLFAKASQRGQSEYVKIPVSMTEKPLGVPTVALENATIYPNPANQYFNVSAATDRMTVEIFSADGSMVKTLDVDGGKARVDVGGLPSGAYLVRISDKTSGATTVKKLLIAK